ncbi:MAG: hypothetical protein KGL54_03685, partial [Sphingomonadales bacterium]|nr:hypothetical protein [Sphingomonadales bacterium]
MIQSAAPTVASALAPLSGQPAENGAQAAGNGTFADLLATQPEAGAAPVQPDEASLAAAALVAAQPNVAGPLPLTGKILPGLLPDAAAGDAGTGGPDEAARTAAGQTIPTLLAAMRAVRLPDQVTAQPRHATQPQAPGAPDAGAATDEADGVAPTGLVPAGSAAPLPGLAAAPTPAPTGSDPAAAGLPPMIAAQLLGQPLREAALVQPQPIANQAATPANPDRALALHLDPARSEAATKAAGTAALSLEAGSAAPTREVRLRPVLASGGEPGPADGAGLFAGALTNAAQPAAVAAPATAPLHATRPHDFAALMDRLITARDAAQTGLPQSVHVALDHADFGPISLSFQHDQGGLAVSVASPDPDFARAVQAAIPAATASAGSDGAARDNGQGAGAQGWTGQSAARGDASAAGGDAGQRQSRGTPFGTAHAAPAANRSAEARDPSA